MFIFRLILLLLPLVMFVLWVMARRKARDKGQDVRQIDVQMVLILAIGILGVLGLAWLLSTGDAGNRNSLYIAPKVVDGKVVPGHFVDPDDAQKDQEKGEGPLP